jgi:hypothetical protein
LFLFLRKAGHDADRSYDLRHDLTLVFRVKSTAVENNCRGRRMSRGFSAWAFLPVEPTVDREMIFCRSNRNAKIRNWERPLEFDAKLVAVGAVEGFAFDNIKWTPKTSHVHRPIGPSISSFPRWALVLAKRVSFLLFAPIWRRLRCLDLGTFYRTR